MGEEKRKREAKIEDMLAHPENYVDVGKLAFAIIVDGDLCRTHIGGQLSDRALCHAVIAEATYHGTRIMGVQDAIAAKKKQAGGIVMPNQQAPGNGRFKP